MARTPVFLGTVVILDTDTQSSVLCGDNNAGIRAALGALVDVIIYAPATLPETCTVYVSWDDSGSWSDMRQLKINGTEITVGAGDAAQVPCGAFRAIGITATGAVAGDRTFYIYGQVETG